MTATRHDRALAYLRQEIELKPREPGARLPTVRQMARAAGVSTEALCRALETLAERGIVQIIPKRGAYYKRAPETAPPQTSEEKWQSLAVRIERDILAGHFRPGASLPQRRELQELYGVSYPTLRRALDILVGRGVLVTFKRSYRVASAHKSAGRASVVCIGLGDETGRLLIQNPRFQEFVFALQNAAALNQIHLALVGHHPRQGLAALFDRIEAQRSQHACIGFVLWNTHVPLPAFLRILAHVKAFGQPVAIMDEKNNLDLAQPLLHEGPVRAFTLAGVSAGRQIARYLLGLGHRRVAFLSCYHGEAWSQRRWRGVHEVFRTTGHPEHARLFALDESDSLWEPGQSPEALRDIYRHFRDYLADVKTAAKNYPASHHLLYLQQHNEKLMRDLQMAVQMRGLLDALAETPDVTACIAANDDMALVVIEHLQRRGLKTPANLSIIGLDDSLRATHFGLTSYNFNFPTIAQRILTFIRNPGLREFFGREELECEGIIMERESTGAPG